LKKQLKAQTSDAPSPPEAAEGYGRCEIARLAEAAIEHAGIISYPVDVIQVAHDNGFKVYAQFLPKNISGMIMVDDLEGFPDFDSSRVIVVNQNDLPLRRRFTIAHELAHFFLHKNEASPLYAHRDEGSRSVLEAEADLFALYLLIPERMLRYALDGIGKKFSAVPESIVRNLISDLFQVTLSEAKQRLSAAQAVI